jgi:sec-independent protein translocase protein TatC
VETLKEARPYVVVGAFVIAAIFTPPDVVSQLLLAFPLWILYEAGLIVSSWLGKREETTGETEQPHSESPPPG